MLSVPLLSPQGSTTDYPSRLLYLPHGTVQFEKLGSLQKFPAGTVIVKPGDIPKYCYAVSKGCVIGYEYTSGGDERIYNVMLMRSLILEANLLTNKPSPVYFKAIKPSELVCIDRQTLIHQITEDPHLALDIIESISYKFFSAMDMVREMKCHDATWMLCNLLLIFADRYGSPYDEKKTLIKEKVSQQLLSNILGVNRITITRIIKTLKDLGLIEQINGYYCISDVKKMKQHLDFLDS
jgi:CRP/FNR family transcriptional regulator